MVSKEQALRCNHFHCGECTRVIGPRGKVTEISENWRRNGKTQTWVTRPEDFRIPVKYGLRGYSEITNTSDTRAFHAVEDCPLKDPAYITKDMRKVS